MLLALTGTALASAAKGDPLLAVLLFIIATQMGLIGWFVRLVLTGRLVPGSERDYWRKFAFEEQAQKREMLVPTAQVVRGMASGLAEATTRDGETE